MKKSCLVWFRKDLRLHDNPALDAAKYYDRVYPLFIMDNEIYENKFLGAASIWWLENSLISLNKSLNGNLKCIHGDSLNIIPNLCSKLEINTVFWNRCYENDRIKKDTKLKDYLLGNNIDC